MNRASAPDASAMGRELELLDAVADALSRETGLLSGTLYPILMRLEARGWLETRWETPPPGGRPPRHMYRLTPGGRASAVKALAETPKRVVRLSARLQGLTPQKAD
jgi:DNA-binding PadR family transcriptional regulator